MTPFKLLALLCCFFVFGASQADDDLWTSLSVAERSATGMQTLHGRAFRLNTVRLDRLLSGVPVEGKIAGQAIISLPLPNGERQRFAIAESPIMAPELAARYPEIKTYKLRGIDEPHSSGRLSVSAKGLHGMISTLNGAVFIDPEGDDLYTSRARRGQMPGQEFSCGVKGHRHDFPLGSVAQRSAARTPGSLRVYRLAVAGTAEYVAATGGTIQSSQTQIVIAINRVNEIYERDLGIRLQLVANNDSLLYTNASTDPYTNNDGFAMLDQNQANIDAVIGPANYDVGHVFSTGGGGIAQVGSVCSAAKAQGVTGLTNPVGETFYIDFVAHEIGHQFDADHSFNGSTNSCQSGREPGTAFEPGSGSTIMAYAGICGAENITINSDAVFHVGSINQIDAFTTSGLGANCGGLANITNNDNYPVANAGSDFTVPVATPLELTGTGIDGDGDTLSYAWEQLDAGTATTFASFGSDLGDNALMRSRLPRAESTRFFPALATVITGGSDPAEVLPTTSRQINFTLTVRDGRSGVDTDQAVITSTTGAGPFSVTSHGSAATLTGGGSQTVSWNEADTASQPVSCATVDVDLLLFNSNLTTYCEQRLATSVPNSLESVNVTLPDLFAARVIFKVSCSNNIFYALSSGQIAMTGSQIANVNCRTVSPTTQLHSNVSATTDPVVGGGGSNTGGSGGGGQIGFGLLIGLLAMWRIRRVLALSA